MAIKKEIGKAVATSDAWLRAKQNQHVTMIQNSTKTLQTNILNSLNMLKTAPDGKLLGLKANLGTSQKLQAKIEQLFYSDFNNHTKKIVRDFKTAQAAIKVNFKIIGEAAKFTDVDKTMMNVLRDGYYADYLAIGDTAKNKVVQSMYDNVIGGGSMQDLTNSINAALVGSAAKGVTGIALAQYARLYARDMIMNYHNEVTMKKADDLGMDTFLYTGNIMGATRDFCRRRVGNPYTKKEINSWKYKWKGKSGPALTHRGGYNCRHHWQPVRKRWLDDKELSMLNKTWRLDKKGVPMTGLSSTAKKRAAEKAAEIRRKLKEKGGIQPPTAKPIVTPVIPVTPKPKSFTPKPKPGVPIIKPFDSDLDMKWRKTDTFPELEKQLKTKYSVSEVIDHSVGPPALTMKKLNLMGEAVGSEIFDQLPDLKKVASSRLHKSTLRKVDFDLKSKRRGDLAAYWKYDKKMAMYESSTVKTVDELSINSVAGTAHNVGMDLKTTFRHEYGHHVHLNILDPTQREIWDSFHRKKGNAWFKKNLSTYSGTNHKEAFAEAFSAYTSPLYGTRGGKAHKFILRMDREMEGVLEKVIGRKKSLLLYDKEKALKLTKEIRDKEIARKAFAKKEAAAKKAAAKKKKADALKKIEAEKLARLREAARAKKLREQGKDVKPAGPVKLNKRQNDVIKLSDENRLNDLGIAALQKKILEQRGIKVSKAQVKKFSKNFENSVPFYMNREMREGSASYKDMMENGAFKNQFQLGRNATSGGSHGPYKGSGRDKWEKNISQGILQKNPKYKKLGRRDYMNVDGIANERPIYGYTSDPNSKAGAYLHGRYGQIVFKLKQKNISKRSTLFTDNTSGFAAGSDTMSSSKNNRIFLDKMVDNSDLTNTDFKKIMQGKMAPKGFTTGYSYTESQMYGGVDLTRDVEMISIPNRRNYGHIVDLANKWGLKYEVRD